MNEPITRIASPRLAKIVRPMLFACIVALSGCTTVKPPQISYDADVPPLPSPPLLAEGHPRPQHVPPSWTPGKGGKKGVAEAKEPVARIETAQRTSRPPFRRSRPERMHFTSRSINSLLPTGQAFSRLPLAHGCQRFSVPAILSKPARSCPTDQAT